MRKVLKAAISSITIPRARRLKFRLKLFAVTALALALVGAAAASKTGTFVPEHQLVPKSSANDSVNDKSVTAFCPAGKKVIGTGGKVSGNVAGVRLRRIVPSTYGVEVAAYEVYETSSMWSVTAYAICAKGFAPHEIVKSSSAFDASTVKAAAATCPSHLPLLGAGADPAGANAAGKLLLTGMFPTPLDKTYKTTVGSGARTSASGGSWLAHSYAICSTSNFLGFGASLGYWYQDGPSDSSSSKSVTRNCPPGKVLLGTGGKINTSAAGKVGLTAIEPSADLKSVTVAGAETGGTTTNWSLSAWAICHNP